MFLKLLWKFRQTEEKGCNNAEPAIERTPTKAIQEKRGIRLEFCSNNEAENKKKLALSSVNAVTNGLLDQVNTGVAQIFLNQKKLESETRILQQQALRFSKQTAQWITLIDQFNTSLKVCYC